MNKTQKVAVVVGVVALGAAALGTAAVGATSGDDHDVPIEGADLRRATSVALDHLGEGRVTGTEVGDEDSYYEVEVTLDDGRQVDVQLDERFGVVGSAADAEDGGDGP